MNKTKTAIIATALATILGGSVYLGSEINRPECDYVVVKEDKEICLSSEQAIIIAEKLKDFRCGFGDIKFGGEIKLFEEK